MITKLKRNEVNKLVGDSIYEHELYYALDQAGDKIGSIYALFGWTHLMGSVHDVNDTVLSLVSGCAEYLVKNPKEKKATHSTAGIEVSVFLGEMDVMEIEIDFKVLN